MAQILYVTNILIDFLRRLVKDAGRKIYLILDNLRVHHAKPVKAWLAEHATTRVGPRGGQVQVPLEVLEAATVRSPADGYVLDLTQFTRSGGTWVQLTAWLHGGMEVHSGSIRTPGRGATASDAGTVV